MQLLPTKHKYCNATVTDDCFVGNTSFLIFLFLNFIILINLSFLVQNDVWYDSIGLKISSKHFTKKILKFENVSFS